MERGELACGLRSLRLRREVSGHPGSSSLGRWVAGAALAVLALISLVLDWNLVSDTGSIDFRNRITGARLLVAGEDPYHYKWLPGAPASWCDVYANRALPITKTTVSPAMLLLGAPLAALTYPLAQKAWLLCEWALLGGIWWLWFGLLPDRRIRIAWTALILGFTYTLAWRHHTDRGQAYVLLVYLFSLWLTLSLKHKRETSKWAGAIAGLLIAVRPPLLLILVPFLSLRRKDQWKGAAAGLAAGMVLPWLLNGDCWANYGKAMSEWSDVYRNDRNPSPGALPYPAEIEGVKLDQIARYAVQQYADSSLFRLLRSWGWAPVPAPIPLGVLLLALGFWFVGSRHRPDEVLLCGLAGWSFLADFFLPAYRNPYNDLMILTGIAFLIRAQPIPRAPLVLCAMALALGWVMIAVMPGTLWLVHLPTLAFLGVAITCLHPTDWIPPRLSGPSPQ